MSGGQKTQGSPLAAHAASSPPQRDAAKLSPSMVMGPREPVVSWLWLAGEVTGQEPSNAAHLLRPGNNLCLHIRNRDTNKALQLIQSKVGEMACSLIHRDNVTPLILAIEKGCMNVATVMIQKHGVWTCNAFVRTKKTKKCALSLAGARGAWDLVKIIITKGSHEWRCTLRGRSFACKTPAHQSDRLFQVSTKGRVCSLLRDIRLGQVAQDLLRPSRVLHSQVSTSLTGTTVMIWASTSK